jgi:hypothetical protein
LIPDAIRNGKTRREARFAHAIAYSNAIALGIASGRREKACKNKGRRPIATGPIHRNKMVR